MQGTTSVTRRRYAASDWSLTTGKHSRGAHTDTTQQAAVQPAPGTTSSILESGTRSPDKIELFDVGTWRAANQHDQTPADLVFVPMWSAWYEIQGVADLSPPGFSLQHVEVTATRVSESETGTSI